MDILYARYEQTLYIRALGILHDTYLAEDAVQEAFLRLIRNRDRLLSLSREAMEAYIYKTLRTAAIDLYRQQRERLSAECMWTESSEDGEWEDPTAVAEEGLYATSTIDALPPVYANVLRCIYVHGLSQRETAAVLKISEACVRKRLERARGLLRPGTEASGGRGVLPKAKKEGRKKAERSV